MYGSKRTAKLDLSELQVWFDLVLGFIEFNINFDDGAALSRIKLLQHKKNEQIKPKGETKQNKKEPNEGEREKHRARKWKARKANYSFD